MLLPLSLAPVIRLAPGRHYGFIFLQKTLRYCLLFHVYEDIISEIYPHFPVKFYEKITSQTLDLCSNVQEVDFAAIVSLLMMSVSQRCLHGGKKSIVCNLIFFPQHFHVFAPVAVNSGQT